MRRSLLSAVVALVVLAGFTGAHPAQARTAGTLAVGGGGAISPGLGLVPAHQTWTFEGVATFTGVFKDASTVPPNPSMCHASGTSAATGETVFSGQGGGVWECTTGLFAGYKGTLTYMRTGPVLHANLQGDLNVTLECVFRPRPPTDVPVTMYDLTCEGAMAER